MGTPAFAVPTLKALHEARHDIACVYSQPPRPAGRGQKETLSPVHQYAAENGIPVFTPVSLKSPEIQAEFAAHNVDIALVAAYGLLLPQPILDAYKLGCINIHPSLLPRWRGAAPLQRTVMAGDKETGICIMQMDIGLDTGDILLQKNFSVPRDFDTGILHDKCAAEAAPMVLQILDQFTSATVTRTKQSEHGVAYAKKITKEECKIAWDLTAEAIDDHIRGLSPAPGAYFLFNDEPIKIFKSRVAAGVGVPGTVLDSTLAIACGDGILIPLEVQRPGKKRMQTAELLNAYPIPAGTKL